MKRILSIMLMILISSTGSLFAVNTMGVYDAAEEDGILLSQVVQASISSDVLREKEAILTPDLVIVEEAVPMSAPVVDQETRILLLKELILTLE